MTPIPSIGVERRQQTNRPVRRVERRAEVDSQAAWLQQALLAKAMLFADRMTLLLRHAGESYAADFESLGQALRTRRIETAVKLHASIPWTIENESGIGGMAPIEHREPRVARTATALRQAMARLKVHSRYGLLPQTA